MNEKSKSPQLGELQAILRELAGDSVWYEVTEDLEKLKAGDRFTLSEVGLTGDLPIAATADGIIKGTSKT